ncbi:hypothetical protein C5167_009103 [Papaver somniferum]|uniref:Uncharacterized protein n=1 Tax=Papaver somniferum TaxID=3469 RepID=A0A4Y7JZI8_PAPSO|nr:hypothetical protein C5167_009103 [Papaver somniferum]
MDTLMRNTSLAFSRHGQSDNYSSVPYEILNHDHDDSNGTSWTEKNGVMGSRRAPRTSSKRKKEQVVPYMMSSMSYRRDRAKNRQIFLKSYKLTYSIETKSIESDNNSLRSGVSRRLTKACVKVKSALVAIVRFVNIDSSLRACAVSGPPAICGSTPTSVIQPVHRSIRK